MKNEIEVPQSALSIPRVEGGDVSPEKGDPVSFHIEGTIRRVENGYCLVQVKFINGKRPGPEPEPEGEYIPTTNDFRGVPAEEAQLQAMAESADSTAANGGY